ncbi:MAG: multidrug effflux MFS transporter [Myxococcota bacterium]
MTPSGAAGSFGHGASGASRELVLLMAGLMSMNALAIDIMLPALGAIGRDLGLTDPNLGQWVVIGFAMGMGFGQLVFGPLSDRYGRKPVLLGSLAAYAVLGAACIFAPDFRWLIAFRFAQGTMSAGARVIAVAVVRDLFEGAAMARTMSLVMMTFMIVPIIAPALGQGVLLFGSWRLIFWFLVAFAIFMIAWSQSRLQETLRPEHRRPISPRSLFEGYAELLTNRVARGYMLALGLVFGCLMAFLGMSEQLLEAFGRADQFALYFAGIAGTMAVANFANARLVQTHGPRRVGHCALLAFIAFQLGHLLTLAAGVSGFVPLYGVLVASFFCLGFMGANFNAVALEPMGHIAGLASAGLGFASTSLAAFFGGFIGQHFDGTAWPFALGFFGLGAAALVVVAHAERGRLDVPYV